MREHRWVNRVVEGDKLILQVCEGTKASNTVVLLTIELSVKPGGSTLKDLTVEHDGRDKELEPEVEPEVATPTVQESLARLGLGAASGKSTFPNPTNDAPACGCGCECADECLRD
jgi:hypothetical protein